MSLVIYRCPSCRKSSFAFPRPAEVARCGSCGEPLNRRRDAAATETEIRERLYAPRPGRGKPRPSEPS